MSVVVRGFGQTHVAVRGFGAAGQLAPLCWVEEVVAYANQPASFTRPMLVSKAPVQKAGVSLVTAASPGYAPAVLTSSSPAGYTVGVGRSGNEVGYSDLGDTYDPAKDCP